MHRWTNDPPTPADLATVLAASCQLWIVSDGSQKLRPDHLSLIRAFFDDGRGLYIWGDNEPYYADANYVAGALFGGRLAGNTPGDHVVTRNSSGRSGMVPNHIICTGLEMLYEGITVATVQDNRCLQPLVYGSARNVVVATYERDGKRAILDGGFTRLFYKWDTAGTGRYIKNAAAWLVNYEHFGHSVYSRRQANS